MSIKTLIRFAVLIVVFTFYTNASADASCSDYDEEICDLDETCQWCYVDQSCIDTEGTCTACNELTTKATCNATDGYCQYCSGATTDPCRESTIPCTCFNGEYNWATDEDEYGEECEDDLGDSDCTNCRCASGTTADIRGGV